jgi:hypothetical protein
MGLNVSRQTGESDADKKAAANKKAAEEKAAQQAAADAAAKQAAADAAKKQAVQQAAQQAAAAKQEADALLARQKTLAAQQAAAALAAKQSAIQAENITAHNESNASRTLVKQPFTTMDSTNNNLYFTPYTIQYYNINIIIEIALYIFFLIILYFIIHKLMKLKRNYGR